jgi:protoporphyrinogen/coproporphyrinogen III oxidase
VKWVAEDHYPARTTSTNRMNPSKMLPVAILWTGVAGLTAAVALRKAGVPVVIYEANSKIAGLASTFKDPDGFSYDFGAHFITNRFAKAIGIDSLCRQVRHYGESVLLRGKAHKYPEGLAVVPRFALSAALSKIRHRRSDPHESSVAEVFASRYGQALASEVAIPLVEAWSGERGVNLSAAVAEKIPISLLQVLWLKLLSAWTGRAIAIGYCKEKPASWRVWHVYPESGLAALCARLAACFDGEIYLNSPIEKIFVESGRTVGIAVNGKRCEVSTVLSTAPVTHLARMVQGTDRVRHFSRFRYRAMAFVNMRFKGRGFLPDVVLWTPSKEVPFFRLTEAPLSMPWLAPAGKTMVTADVGCIVGDQTWSMKDEDLGGLCLEAMNQILPGRKKSYLGCTVLRTPFAYPVFLREYESERCRLRQGTGVEGLYSIGRNGEFDHLLTEDVYWRTLSRIPQITAFLNQRISEPIVAS